MFGFLKKKTPERKSDPFMEALGKAGIAYIYDAEEGRFSYINRDAEETVSVYRKNEKYEYGGEEVSEEEALGIFRKEQAKEEGISACEDDPEYGTLMALAEMAEAISGLFPGTKAELDYSEETGLSLVEKKNGGKTVLAAQKDGQLWVNGDTMSPSDEEAAALKMSEYFHRKHYIYWKSGGCDFGKLNFRYRELFKQFIITVNIMHKIEEIPNVEVQLTDGKTIFVIFKNNSAIAYEVACKRTPEGVLTIYDFNRVNTPERNSEYRAVKSYLDISKNVTDKPDV